MTNDKSVTNLAKDLTLGDHKIIFCFLFGGGERSECFGCKTVSGICTSRLSEEKKTQVPIHNEAQWIHCLV